MSIKKVTLVSAGNVFNSVVGFAFLAVVAKTLAINEFGMYAVLTSLLTSVGRLMDFGTNSAFVAKSITSNEDVPAFYGLKVFQFIFVIPVSIVALLFFQLLNSTILILFFVGLLGYLYNYTSHALFQRHQQYLHLVLLNTIPTIMKGIITVLVLMGFIKLSVASAFGIFVFSILGGLVLIPWLKGDYKKLKIDLTFSKALKSIKQCISPGISQSIFEGWLTINNAVAKFLATFSDIGIFALANKMSNIFSILAFSIFTVLLPKNANRKKLNLKHDFVETFVLSLGLIIGSFVVVLFSDIVIKTLFGSKYEGSISILNVLIFASAITAVHNFNENYFYIQNKTKYLMSVNLAKLVLFLVLAWVFMSFWGLLGLALANLVSSIVGLVLIALFINSIERGYFK